MADSENQHLVQLVGPSSYTQGALRVQRGQVVRVSKRTRDYLVLQTGYFIDYDPNPAPGFAPPTPTFDNPNPEKPWDDSDFAPGNVALPAEQAAIVDETGDLTAKDVTNPPKTSSPRSKPAPKTTTKTFGAKKAEAIAATDDVETVE